jgi:hypothetical protein
LWVQNPQETGRNYLGLELAEIIQLEETRMNKGHRQKSQGGREPEEEPLSFLTPMFTELNGSESD